MHEQHVHTCGVPVLAPRARPLVGAVEPRLPQCVARELVRNLLGMIDVLIISILGHIIITDAQGKAWFSHVQPV